MTVESKIADIVRDKLGCDYKDPKQTFESLGGDSLDQIEIVMAIEDAYDLTIDSEDGDKIKSPADAIEYVKRHVKPQKVSV